MMLPSVDLRYLRPGGFRGRLLRVKPGPELLNPAYVPASINASGLMRDQLATTASDGPLLTARAVADRLGVSTESVLRWTRCGRLPGFRLPGGALRYRAADLDAWLARRATPEMPGAASATGVRPPSELSRVRQPKRRGDDRDARDPA